MKIVTHKKPSHITAQSKEYICISHTCGIQNMMIWERMIYTKGSCAYGF